MTVSATTLQARVVKECFGATLSDLGRGFFVGLELFAILRGVFENGGGSYGGLLPSQLNEPIRYLRHSHDFARRMPAEPVDLLTEEEQASALDGETTRETLAALVDALTVPFPGSRRVQPFKRRLLYPFVGELVHYDAVDRPSRAAGVTYDLVVEEYTYRGGGGLAHKILRTDPDAERLANSRIALAGLVSDSGTPLGSLATALRSHDRARGAGMEYTDAREFATTPRTGGARWIEELRAGTANIAGRESLTRAKRVELLLHWVPYCIARYQLDVALDVVGELPMDLPVDLRSSPNTIRRASQTALARCPTLIGDALARVAERLAEEVDDADEAAGFRDIARRARMSRATMKSARAFFASTLWGVGATNAATGIRHFTLRLPMLEALVAAGIPPGREMQFTEFCHEVLHGRFGLVLDGRSGRSSALGDHIDTAEFEENAEVLARHLTALGLLTEYSDATRIVRDEGAA
jgi:hypothetical protein